MGTFPAPTKTLFEARRDLSVKTEDAQYNFGEMQLEGRGKQGVSTSVTRNEGGVLITEILTASIPFDAFAQIANSKKVEILVGQKRFNVKSDHLRAFSNFVLLMKEQGLEF
jgi:hypothetical protein